MRDLKQENKMETINDLPDNTFWQPEADIKKDLKELAIRVIIELRKAKRYNAALAIEELFNIDENDIQKI